MPNVVSSLATLSGPNKFLKGRGIRFDNKDGEIQVIDHDGSTIATITAAVLKRIEEAVFYNAAGALLSPTVAGLATGTLTVTNLPADTQDITVLMKGSRI